jgi:xanthine phosphoribosyltransferase
VLKNHKNILIVDDIVDSGETLQAVAKVLQQRYPSSCFKTATLFYKKDAIIKPDFTINEAKEWIDFFWEVDIDRYKA